jgi:hypothetical protein
MRHEWTKGLVRRLVFLDLHDQRVVDIGGKTHGRLD